MTLMYLSHSEKKRESFFATGFVCCFFRRALLSSLVDTVFLPTGFDDSNAHFSRSDYLKNTMTLKGNFEAGFRTKKIDDFN